MGEQRSRWIIASLATLMVAGEILVAFARFVAQESRGGGPGFDCVYARCAELAGAGDRGWYLRAAQDLFEAGHVTSAFSWVYALWPPGMVGLNLAFLKLFGPDRSVVAFHLALSTIVLTAVLVAPVWSSRTLRRTIITALIAVVVPYMAFMTAWVLGIGLLYADGYAAAMLVLGASALVFMQVGPSIPPVPVIAGSGGVLLAASAYLRSSYEVVVNMLLVLALAALLAQACVYLMRRRGKPTSALRATVSDLRNSRMMVVVVGLLLAQVIMLPWRVWVHDHVTGQYGFSVVSDQAWIGGWQPSSLIVPGSLQSTWSQNGFCEAYPRRCAEIATVELAGPEPYSGKGAHSGAAFRSMAVAELVRNPFPWIYQRGRLVLSYWGYASWWPQPLWSVLFTTAGLIGSLALSLARLVRRGDPSALVLIGGVVSLTFLAPMMSHFEGRYLVPAQMCFVFLAFFIARGRSTRLRT